MRTNIIALLLILVLFLNSCGIYSFTGASISPETKTISIQYFPNNAPLFQPTLSQSLTDAVKDRFINQTNLEIIENGGDLNISGEITNYNTRPIAIQGNETAALNRLSITIKVRFINNIDENKNYESTFTRYEDYESSQSLSDVEENLITQINLALVDDIFNKAVVNW